MKQSNLILHCGANRVAREAIAAVATPAATDSWHPIPHMAFIEQVETALRSTNMQVVNQEHSLSHEDNRYFGLMQVSNCRSAGEDFSYVLGLRNSHDKTFPAGLVVGASVFVCDNLSFSGEIKIARRHTTFIMRDLPGLTGRAIGMLSEKWTRMSDRIARYKEYEMNDRDVHDFLIRSVDAGAATIQQVPHILNEWRQPRHPEFGERTAWRLFNAYTEIGKTVSLPMLPRRTIALHGLMDAQVGLLGFNADQVAGNATDVDVVVNN